MLTAIYWFCLIVGGGLAALQVFGDFLDGGDADFDADLDADFDADLDADLDADAVGPEIEADAIDGQAGVEAARILSLRGLIYGVLGFGLIGLVLSWIFPGDPMMGLGFAIGGGLVSSVLVTRTVDWLRTSEVGGMGSDTGFAGRSGKVLVPIHRDVPGQIRVTRGGRTHRLRALPHPTSEEGDPEEWDEVVVVEVEEGIAYVSPPEELGWDRLEP